MHQECSCHTKVWLDSNQFYGGFSDWSNHLNRPVRCEFSTATRSITKIMVKICSEDDTQASEEMTLVLENDDGERCTTRRLQVSDRQALVNFSPGQMGSECANFKVTSTTKVLASTPDNASLCLSHVILDTADKLSPKARSQICKFDQNEFFKIYTEEKMSIPLICT